MRCGRRTAAAYDATADAVAALPNMAQERDEASTKFIALGEYQAEAQGRFADGRVAVAEKVVVLGDNHVVVAGSACHDAEKTVH